jgi:isoquinoline 1-oxidoreductase subunit alpha
MARIILKVNNERRQLQTDADKPLLWALREDLGLRGTKYGCGAGVCGSCTVLVDGELQRSCITPMREVAGRNVQTIEGLSPDGSHPVQRAWLEEEVAQCGYCQPGQIMTAVALLKKHKWPTDVQIDEMMSDVVCRCGTYLRIRSAIHRAAKEQK